MEYISREDALNEIEFGITYAKAFNKETGQVVELFKESNKELSKAAERVKALPAADVVERKKGKWIKSNIPNEKYVCSECGGACWYYDCKGKVAKSNFCPNCGADMREVDE